MSRFAVFNLLSTLYVKAILHPEKDKIISHRIMGFSVSAYGYGDLLYLFKEIFLNSDYYFKAQSSKPQIIDCGANIGMTVLYFKTLYPESSILAFEPNPYAYELLVKNVNDNKLQNITIQNIALSDKVGDTDFFLDHNRGSLVGSTTIPATDSNRFRVKTDRLSAFMKNEMFDFVKIDVEGAENEIVADLVGTGRIGNVNQYVVEYHHDMATGRGKLATFLSSFERSGFGYRLSTNAEMHNDFQNVLIEFYRNGQR